MIQGKKIKKFIPLLIYAIRFSFNYRIRGQGDVTSWYFNSILYYYC